LLKYDYEWSPTLPISMILFFFSREYYELPPSFAIRLLESP